MTRIHQLLGQHVLVTTTSTRRYALAASSGADGRGPRYPTTGSPLSMLTSPRKNDFVQSVFGRSELGVRLFSLRSVGDYVRRHEQLSGDALVEEMTLRDALSMFAARRCARPAGGESASK